MRGADLIVQYLREAGVRFVFGVPGTTNMDLIDGMYGSRDIRYISARHEQVAASMADACGRLIGNPGVVITHAGSGAANVALGIAIAHRDGTPLVLFTGNYEGRALPKEPWQSLNQLGLYKAIVKWSAQPKSAGDLPRVIQKALKVTMAGRPGPVHVDLPLDVSRGEVALPARRRRFKLEIPHTQAPEEVVVRAAELLAAAERPIILAGWGAVRSGAAPEVDQLSRLLSVPVVSSNSGRGIVPEDHPHCAGVSGRLGDAAASAAMKESDAVLALGVGLSDLTTGDWTLIQPGAKLIHVNAEPAELRKYYTPEVGVAADAKTFLVQLLEALERRGPARGANGDRVAKAHEAFMGERRGFLDVPLSGSPVQHRQIPAAAARVLDRDAITTVGAGTHSRYASRVFCYQPGANLKAVGLGSMCFAFPAAMGAKLTRPQNQVVCFVGDGDFGMVLQDLETAVRERIGVVCVIFNDFSFASQKAIQRNRFQGRYLGTDFTNPDFARLAELFGARGQRVERAEQLQPALEEALRDGRPAVIDVILNREVLE
ncbi:MAG: thiamine pyrophosphate-binding protein [Deltaproteobacteria bacterium]|nr:thiamine pyrophosphate-binding protein [Deltaproteobacteria bacterium]